MNERMRIFEDEIIKRIKIIKIFVKNLDGKISRIRNSGKKNSEQVPERLQETIKGVVTHD